MGASASARARGRVRRNEWVLELALELEAVCGGRNGCERAGTFRRGLPAKSARCETPAARYKVRWCATRLLGTPARSKSVIGHFLKVI